MRVQLGAEEAIRPRIYLLYLHCCLNWQGWRGFGIGFAIPQERISTRLMGSSACPGVLFPPRGGSRIHYCER
jgi:hypothetical protein